MSDHDTFHRARNPGFSCAGPQAPLSRTTWVGVGLMVALGAAILAHLWLLPAMVHPAHGGFVAATLEPAYPIWNGLERWLLLLGATALLAASLVPLLWLRHQRWSRRLGVTLAALGALMVLGVTVSYPPRLAPHLGLPRWSFDGALHVALLTLSMAAGIWAVAGRRRRRIAGWVLAGAAVAGVTLLLVPQPAKGEGPDVLYSQCDPLSPLIPGRVHCNGSEQNPPRDRAVPLARFGRALELRRQSRQMLLEHIAYYASGACATKWGGPPPRPVTPRVLMEWLFRVRTHLLPNAWLFLVWQELRWICVGLAILLVSLWALLGAGRRRGGWVARGVALTIAGLGALAALTFLPEATHEPLWKHLPNALWVPLGIALLVTLAADDPEAPRARIGCPDGSKDS